MSEEARVREAVRCGVANFCGHDWPDGKPLPDLCPECEQIVDEIINNLRQAGASWQASASQPSEWVPVSTKSAYARVREFIKGRTWNLTQANELIELIRIGTLPSPPTAQPASPPQEKEREK